MSRRFGIGTLAARPAAGNADDYYWATDTREFFRDNGVTWDKEAVEPHTDTQHSDGPNEKTANKGAVSGYAGLDAATKVPTAQLGGAGADVTKYLRGDQSWQVPAGGGAIAEGRAKSATVTYLSIPGIEAGTSGTYTLIANMIYYEPILVPTDITLDRIIVEVSVLAAGATARLGIYNADADWQPTSLVLDAGTVSVATTGFKSITINQALSAGRYLLAVWSDGTPSLRLVKGGSRYAGFNDTLGTSPFLLRLVKASAYGVYPDPGTLWDVAGTSPTPFNHTVFVRISTP